MMQKISFSIMLLVSIMLFSCSSDKLDRENSLVILKEQANFPKVETGKFELHHFYIDRYRSLFQQGLFETFASSPGIYATSNGIKYAENQKRNSSYFAVSLLEIDEVTGIAFNNEEETEATVEFTVKRTQITPFGQHLELTENSTLIFSTEFKKYDDGWRVGEIKNKENYQISNLENFGEVFKATNSDKDINNKSENKISRKKIENMIGFWKKRPDAGLMIDDYIKIGFDENTKKISIQNGNLYEEDFEASSMIDYEQISLDGKNKIIGKGIGMYIRPAENFDFSITLKNNTIEYDQDGYVLIFDKVK